MARILEDQTGVEAPSTDYPNGRVVNNETLINEEINGDIIQFFQWLLHGQGILANGLPDNATNGYQFPSALKRYVDTLVLEDNAWIIVPDSNYGAKFTRGYGAGDARNLSYRITKDGYLELRGGCLNGSAPVNGSDKVFTLPSSDLYPPYDQYVVMAAGDDAGVMQVNDNGDVRTRFATASFLAWEFSGVKIPLQ